MSSLDSMSKPDNGGWQKKGLESCLLHDLGAGLTSGAGMML